MLILGIEASGNSASVALVQDEITLASVTRQDRHGHAGWITQMVDSLLAEAKSDFSAISHIAVGCGPGSFTGIRVGLAAAHGYGLGLGIPVLGVSSLESLAYGAAADHRALALIDTRRGHLFAQMFSGGKAISEVYDASQDELVDHLSAHLSQDDHQGAAGLFVHGCAASTIADILSKRGHVIPQYQDADPDAIMAASMVASRLASGEKEADFPATPHYHSSPLLGPAKAKLGQG
jgi:tRNA threonylcarbamoyladenosine biosynthesis protein TsaB